MKEVILTDKELSHIRSDAISKYVAYSKGEYAHINSILESFLEFCSNKGYTIKNGKVFSTNEEEKKPT